MAKGILALIIPVDPGARPDNTLPGSQPEIDNTLPGQLPRPEHPIYYPLPPGAPPPVIDNALPGAQPGIDNTLPGDQPEIDNTLPPLPPGSGGWEPVYIWGPGDPRPGTGLPTDQPEIDNTLPPIEVPPPGETEDGAKIEWKCAWTPTTGWISFAIVIPGADTPVVTPSKGKRK